MDSLKDNGIAYCRVSSNEQVKGTSLEMQEKLCEGFAKQENIEMAKLFIEEGASAKSADRPEFQKALAFCLDKKNNIKHFIVYKIDRFARNQDDHVTVQALLRKAGVKLRSVTEPIDETPMGRAMEGMLSVFAELDNNVRAQRSKSGMEERVKKGVWVWNSPIGYKRLIKGGNLIIDEDFAIYIKLAFEEWSKGTYSYRSLSDYLYQRGFRSKSGKKIQQQSIEKIIRNPIYCGFIHAFNMEIKGSFEPIIDEYLFFKCQPNNIKKSSLISRSLSNPDFPLRKICCCSQCKTNMTGSYSRGNGGKYPYYHHSNKNCSITKSYPKNKFEADFIKFLKRISPKHQKYEKLFKAIVLDVWQKNYKKLDSDNIQLRKEIESLEQDRQKVFDAHRIGTYSDDDFIEQKNYINKKIQEKKMLLEEKRIEEFNMEEALSFCFDFVRDSGKTWEELEEYPEYRLRFQKLIFPEKITYNGEKFGTNRISLVYKLQETSGANSSNLVTLPGIEPGFKP